MSNKPDKKYPFQNKNLRDLPGEKWKEIPDWPDYHISNYGRAKSTGRMVLLNFGREGYKKDMILSQQVRKAESPFNGDTLHYLSVRVQQGDFRRTFRTARLVYYLFVSKYRIEDIKRIIQYKDGDGFNIRPSNLILSTNSIKMLKVIKNKRTPHLKEVTQFSLDGKKIKTFVSMGEAAESVNGYSSRIYAVLEQWPHYYKGYLWRKGDRKRTPALKKPLINPPKKVIQVSLKGKQLKIFPSLNQAAKRVDATNSNLRKALNGGCRTCRGYKWKWG